MYMYDYFILLIINNEFEWAYCRYGKVYVLKHLIYDTKVVNNGKHLNPQLVLWKGGCKSYRTLRNVLMHLL